MSAGLWLAVAGVGGAASVLRFLVGDAIANRFGRGFPYGTLVINLTGAFILGLLTGLGLGTNAMLVAGTATVGSYTTFSTWMLESERLTENGGAGRSTVNLFVPLVVGVAAAALGRTLGTTL